MRFTMKSWNWPHIPRGLVPPKTSKRRWYLSIPDSGIYQVQILPPHEGWAKTATAGSQNCYNYLHRMKPRHHLCLWKPTSSWQPESLFLNGQDFWIPSATSSETLTLFSRVYAKPSLIPCWMLRQPMGHRTLSVARKSTQTFRRPWLS